MNTKVICVVIGLCLTALCAAGPVVEDSPRHIDNSIHTNEHSSVEDALMKKLGTKCTNNDVSSCMMLKLVTYFNRLLKKSSIEFGEVEITQTSTETIAPDTSRSINAENMSEESQFSELMYNKVFSFIKTRSLKWKVTDDADIVVSGGSDKDGSFNFGLSIKPDSSNLGDARKKKGGGGLGAIIGAVALKIGLLKALAFKGLALLVGKALLVSKLALVLALVIGLKKLLSSEKYVTYEVVAHPHHEHHHEHSISGGGHDGFSGGHGGHGHGGWGRSAAEIAYRGQKPAA